MLTAKVINLSAAAIRRDPLMDASRNRPPGPLTRKEKAVAEFYDQKFLSDGLFFDILRTILKRAVSPKYDTLKAQPMLFIDAKEAMIFDLAKRAGFSILA